MDAELVEIVTTDELDRDGRRRVRALIDRAFDGEFGDDDWAHSCGGSHVLVRRADALIAHAAVVDRRIEIDGVQRRVGYVEGVAAEPSGCGAGTAAMRVANDLIRAQFELGLLSTGAWHFYERLGWERWLGPSAVRRRGGSIEPTPDDDGGIMVLRTPTAATFRPPLDVTSSIVCDDRPGDVW